jgi:hypothetical protein
LFLSGTKVATLSNMFDLDYIKMNAHLAEKVFFLLAIGSGQEGFILCAHVNASVAVVPRHVAFPLDGFFHKAVEFGGAPPECAGALLEVPSGRPQLLSFQISSNT